MADDDALEAVERWFRSRGIPHLIGDCSASRDVFTRALPPLEVAAGERLTALDTRQWGDVGLVVLFTQGLQIVLISAIAEQEVWGRPVALTTELLQAFEVRAVYPSAHAAAGG